LPHNVHWIAVGSSSRASPLPRRVADRGQHGLGDLALAAVDECQLHRTGQMRIALLDSNVCHDELLMSQIERRPAGRRLGCPEN
jgi:hypothetical protein